MFNSEKIALRSGLHLTIDNKINRLRELQLKKHDGELTKLEYDELDNLLSDYSVMEIIVDSNIYGYDKFLIAATRYEKESGLFGKNYLTKAEFDARKKAMVKIVIPIMEKEYA